MPLPTVEPTGLIDADLYLRVVETLLASWEEYARAAAGATVDRLPGVAVAAFPHEPERTVYKNALLQRISRSRSAPRH